MDFTSRLRALREDGDMLQNELAALLNLKPSAISKYEKGITQPGLPTLVRIADIFKVSVDYLLGVSGVKNPYTQERLSPREAEIISRFRKLSRENQIRIDERLNAMLDFERDTAKRPRAL